MSELVERLRAACIDWDGSQQDDAEMPRVELHCRDLREAADRIEALEAKEAAGQWQFTQPPKDRPLLDILPLHWHDEPTTNLRDVVSDIESARAAIAKAKP